MQTGIKDDRSDIGLENGNHERPPLANWRQEEVRLLEDEATVPDRLEKQTN